MPFTPSVQSLVCAHSGPSGPGINWANNTFFQTNSTYLSRYGILSGLEEAFVDMSTLGTRGGTANSPIGLGTFNHMCINQVGTFTNPGSALIMDQTTFTVSDDILYPGTSPGGGGINGVQLSGIQFFVDRGVGNPVIPTLNRVNEIGWFPFGWIAEQDMPGQHQAACSDPTTPYIAWIVGADTSDAGPLYLYKLLYSNLGFWSFTQTGTVSMASIDASWTGQFGIQGVCVDQTDGQLLFVMRGHGGSNVAYLAKISRIDASVIWKSVIPPTNGGSAVGVGNAFGYSSIKNGYCAFYTGSPATVTIYKTSDGSISSQYNSGIAGFFPTGGGGQAYNDTLGGLALLTDFTQGSGSPTLLNSTPTSWSNGWCILYVAAGITPTVKRRYLGEWGPTRVSS